MATCRVFSRPTNSIEDEKCSTVVYLVDYGELPSDAHDLPDHLVREGFALNQEYHWSESLDQWSALVKEVMTNQDNRLVLRFNAFPDKNMMAHICSVVMDVCVQQRRRSVCLVKNFPNFGKESLGLSRRALKMLCFIDLSSGSESYQRLVQFLKSDPGGFSSPGESFTWQLITGFLCYILPFLSQRVSSQLADETGSARPQALKKFNVNGVDARRIVVIPKYFLLLSRAAACGLEDVQLCPQQLFPGCRKIQSSLGTDSRSEFCLEFDSPVYKKRIPAYLTELEKPLPSGHTHAIIFCGYAAPIFIIRQLELSQDERGAIFDDFISELQYIMNHPSCSQLLCDLGGSGQVPCTGKESSAAVLIESLASGDSLKNQIFKEIKDFKYSPIEDSSSDWVLCDPPDCGDDVEVDGFAMVDIYSPKTLCVKFSRSFNRSVKDSVLNSLSNLDFSVNTEQSPKRRVLLVLQAQDLKQIGDPVIRSDIRLAVQNMHHSGCYNISVIIEAGEEHQTAFECLPSGLQYLPDKCIVAVSSLSKLNSLQLSFPHGSQRLLGFSDLVNVMGLGATPISANESLPLMSMAFAMAANCWFGFAKHLLHSLPTSLPYCFVIPSSGRFPEEKRLYDQLERIEVSWRHTELHGNGRRYTVRVHEWRGRSIAFEVPASLLALRRQAECCIGGIRASRLSSQLAEFSAELAKYCANSNGQFRVVHWDDEAQEAGAETACNYDSKLAESLMQCLQRECSDRW